MPALSAASYNLGNDVIISKMLDDTKTNKPLINWSTIPEKKIMQAFGKFTQKVNKISSVRDRAQCWPLHQLDWPRSTTTTTIVGKAATPKIYLETEAVGQTRPVTRRHPKTESPCENKKSLASL